MERIINGIRDTFYHDITEDYLEKGRKSILYGAFWSEYITDLLKEHFPGISVQEPPQLGDARELTRQMRMAMKEEPELYRAKLLHTEEQLRKERGLKKDSKPRRNLWKELWLNDVGYKAGLITDTEYYLWLAEYLAAHNIFKSDVIYLDEFGFRKMRSSHLWVGQLLCKGLGMNAAGLKEELKSGKKGARKKTAPQEEKVLSKAEVKGALKLLAEQIRRDRDAVAGRLHDLKYKDGDYLAKLSSELKRLALHDDIKEWLQNGGYSLTLLQDKEDKEKPGEARKKDQTMRIFEQFCNSEKGYHFRRKSDGDWKGKDCKEGDAVPADWHVDGRFCVLDTDGEQLKRLMEAFEEDNGDLTPEETYLYIPLAVHLQSGCVFFLAGKNYYERAYQAELDKPWGKGLWAKYKNTNARFCFDHLRLDPKSEPPAFCLTPCFHENAIKKYGDAPEQYKAALDAFKYYCDEHEIEVREYNGGELGKAPGEFLWAFDARPDEDLYEPVMP